MFSQMLAAAVISALALVVSVTGVSDDKKGTISDKSSLSVANKSLGFTLKNREALVSNIFKQINMDDSAPLNTVYSTTKTIEHMGKCGKNVDYTLYSDGTMIISGVGMMEDYYGPYNQPWSGFRNDIKKVIIKEGISSIGRYAFNQCYNLNEVIISTNLTRINGSAFESCGNLVYVVIMGNVDLIDTDAFKECGRLHDFVSYGYVHSIGQYAFYMCGSLKNMVIQGNVKWVDKRAFRTCGGAGWVLHYGGVNKPQCAKEVFQHSHDIRIADIASEHNFGDFCGKPIEHNVLQNTTDGVCGDNVKYTLDVEGTLTISGVGSMKNYFCDIETPWYSRKHYIKKIIVEKGVTSIGNWAKVHLITVVACFQ